MMRLSTLGLGIVLVLLVLVLIVGGSGQSVAPPQFPSDLSVDDPSFPRTVEAYTSPVVAGNVVEVLLNGDQIFPAKLTAIRGAQRTINYAEYFYAEGPPAQQIADALAERCRAGIVANILLDGFGTITMPSEYVARMKEAGCRVVTFRPVGRLGFGRHNHRNHRRILVVDGRIGLTGGSGVSEKWTGDGRTDGHWRDTDIRLEGPAVGALQAAFAENWREATGEVLGGAVFFPQPHLRNGGVRVHVVRSSAIAGGHDMYTTLLFTISAARRFIHVTNPYFLPDDRMTEALLAAVQRGVRVVVLTPGKIDHNVVRAASRRDFGRLLMGGIEIFEYQAALLHAKTVVVDGVLAAVGSTNLDHRSLALNEELDVVVYDPGFAGRLGQVFQQDLARSSRVNYETWQNRGLRAKLLELLVAPIENQL